jgi:perosamine synthetase
MGLWAIWQALEIKGCEIITSPLSWGGSIAGLLQCDNKPIFLDINPETLCLDPKLIEKAITPKTKAILSVDIFGFPSFGKELRKLADKHELYFIQDCAQSFGSYEKGRHTGHFADVAVYSLGCGKPLCGGEGAVIITPHKELYEKLVWLTQHPNRQKRDIPQEPINELFYNLRIHPVSAIIANLKFESTLMNVAEHRKKCYRVIELLEQENAIHGSNIDYGNYKSAYYSLTVVPKSGFELSDGLSNLCEINFSTLRYDPLLYQQRAFQEFAKKKGWSYAIKCPVAEDQIRRRKEVSFKLKTCI